MKICTEEIALNPQNMDAYYSAHLVAAPAEEVPGYDRLGDQGDQGEPAEMRVLESVGEAYFYLDDYKVDAVLPALRGRRAPGRVSVAYFFMGEIFRIQKRVKHADIAYTTALSSWSEPAALVVPARLGAGAGAGTRRPWLPTSRSLSPTFPEAQEGLDRTKKRL